MKETLFTAFLSQMSQKLQYMRFEDTILGQVSFGGFPATCASLLTRQMVKLGQTSTQLIKLGKNLVPTFLKNIKLWISPHQLPSHSFLLLENSRCSPSQSWEIMLHIFIMEPNLNCIF